MSFSPLVEDTAPGVVVFSIVGLSRLIGSPKEICAVVARRGAEAGIQANLAVSADPDTAVLMASNRKGLTLIPPGKETDALSGLPVEVLAVFEQWGTSRSAPLNSMKNNSTGSLLTSRREILETLHRWGIKTLGELAELPELGMIARFGEEGTRLLRLVRGETRRSLRTVQAPESYERRADFEHPQSLLEPLSFVLSSMLSELMEALARQGLAANRVALDLRLAGPAHSRAPHRRTLEFPVPVHDPNVILKQLQFDLEAHPPKAAILGVRISLNPVEPRTLQHGLFTPQAPAPEKLQLTLARLAALAGEGNVGSPYLMDTHRRDAFRMRTFAPEQDGEEKPPAVSVSPRYAFRYYRPPLPVQVRIKAEMPVHVSGVNSVTDSAKGEVVAAAGPWRASGDWWAQSLWAREEWDIELSNGGVYRLFLSLLSGQSSTRAWFLEGMYD